MPQRPSLVDPSKMTLWDKYTSPSSPEVANPVLKVVLGIIKILSYCTIIPFPFVAMLSFALSSRQKEKADEVDRLASNILNLKSDADEDNQV